MDDALAKLERWGLVERRNDRLVVPPLPEAKARLDRLWDHFSAFQESESP